VELADAADEDKRHPRRPMRGANVDKMLVRVGLDDA
jgi:hypothetical protein